MNTNLQNRPYRVDVFHFYVTPEKKKEKKEKNQTVTLR